MRTTFSLCRTGVANGGDFLAMGEGTHKVGWRMLAVDFSIDQGFLFWERVFDIGQNAEVSIGAFDPFVRQSIERFLHRYHAAAVAYRARIAKESAEQ